MQFKGKEARRPCVFSFPNTILTKTEVRGMSDSKRQDFGGRKYHYLGLLEVKNTYNCEFTSERGLYKKMLFPESFLYAI